MGGFVIDGIRISANAKTGNSINVNSCSPTKWCAQFCYRLKRSLEEIKAKGWESTPNNGPITWDMQVASYVRNEERIRELHKAGTLKPTAIKIANRLKKRGVTHLRGNGTGDLFPGLVALYALLAREGIKVYLFSRLARQIVALKMACDDLDVAPSMRPYVLGSTDRTTHPAVVYQLVLATWAINGEPALAYATEKSGDEANADIDNHPGRRHLKVVFGYHTNHKKTVVGNELECPGTSGSPLKCAECKRCLGPELAMRKAA